MSKRKAAPSPRKRTTLEEREARHTSALNKIKLQKEIAAKKKELRGL